MIKQNDIKKINKIRNYFKEFDRDIYYDLSNFELLGEFYDSTKYGFKNIRLFVCKKSCIVYQCKNEEFNHCLVITYYMKSYGKMICSYNNKLYDSPIGRILFTKNNNVYNKYVYCNNKILL